MRAFFTIPDLDINQETSVDPMGVQVIWTHLGQQIFADKLTTIANDLRVFTFNIFHQHLINKLMADHTEELHEAKKYYQTWKTEFDVKAGLLMFLEDLVTHIFYHCKEDHTNAETIGILGLNKVRSLYQTYAPENIYLSASKRMGILKNQLILGMTGRYKGPMMNMSFFDRSFTLLPQTRESVNHFMLKWNEAIELEDHIIKLLTKHLFQSGKRDFPRLSIAEIKQAGLWKKISEGYLICFGKRKLPRDIRNFWKDKLGLISGSSAALYKEISDWTPGDPIRHEDIFMGAKKYLKNEPEELLKIDQVLDIEPFLSHTEFLLRFLAQPEIKHISDEEKELKQLRELIIRSAGFSIPPALPRLKELHQLMLKEGSLIDWLQQVLLYHHTIMNKRGGTKWLEMDAKGTLKHYFSPPLPEDINTIKKYTKEQPWLHHYYLGTLWSIHQGLK
jgi:hypothetical protein